ncbi:MAG: 2-dehydro-3-deoxy-D-gluconate 5-dehydrogenase KduD [Thermomicrobiales bacterium]
MIFDAFQLDGRVALVTGAARGLGQGIALGLAEAGADVVVLDVLDPDETVERITALDRRAHPLSRDLLGLTENRAGEIVADAIAPFGRLDILVNNAGIIRRAPALDFRQADWDAVLSINLSAAFLLCQAFARQAIVAGTGGKVINMASLLSFQGGTTVPAYAAAKSGIAGMTRALANEWAQHNINVNALAPGYFATELTSALRADPARAEPMLGRIPAGRWGNPTDLQGAAVFLASDAAAYVHGVILPVDGGWLAW